MTRRDQARSLVGEAARHEAAGRYAEAAASYRAAVEADPTDLDATTRLARCYEAARQWSYAVETWRSVVSLAADRADLIVGLAEALRQARCHLAALAAYDRVLELEPEHLFGRAGKAETLRMLGRFSDALTWFDEALAVHPQHAFALRGKAATLNALHRYTDADACWSQALSLEPNSIFAQQGQEETHRRMRELAQDAASRQGPTAEPPPPEGARLEAERWWEWGRALLHDDRPGDAAQAFTSAIEAAPTWAKPRADLGQALERNNRWAEAAEAHARHLALEPERVDAACNHAECLRKCDRYDEALSAYETALAIDPDYVFALAGHAEALRMLGRNHDALGGFDAALARKPTHAFALRGKAATLHSLDRFEEALVFWKRSLDVDPDSNFATAGLAETERALTEAASRPERDSDPARSRARTHYDMGRAYLQQGRTREAISALRKATEADDEWHEPWFLQGVAWEEERQFPQAVRAFDACLLRQVGHIEAAVHKADCLRKHADLPGALEAYDDATENAPDDLRVLSGRAETLRLLGRFEEALLSFDQVLAVQERHYFALCGKAASLNALGRYDEARPFWLKARQENPSSSFVKRGLAHCLARAQRSSAANPPNKDARLVREAMDRGRTLHKAGDREGSAAAYREALTLDPTSAEAALRLGMVLEDDRRFAQAIEAYGRCLALDPNSHQAATNIGEAHRKNERYREAISAYDRALAVRQDYLYALAGRAECMRMLGQYEDSLSWFDRALAKEPRHAFAIQGKAASFNALHRFAEALPLWNQALDIDPRSQFALDGKAFCEAQLRRVEGAADGNPSADESEASESATPTLDEQGRDLTALALAGKLGEVIGRRTEIRAVMKTLVRRQKANPLLVGDPGVGKTAVVEGLAQALVADDVPARLANLRVVELSMGSLVAGTKYRGTFEDRLKKLVEEAKSTPGIVLFIDEIHTLVGAGRTEGGSLDAANILKPALARGEITVIGATTMAEFRKHIESDSALERRFQPVNIEEPSAEDALTLLRTVAHRYAEHHEVEIDDAALRACVKLSVRFLPDRRLPDKALDLVDEACAEASLEGHAVVTSTVVAQVLSERTGIPVGQLTAEERQKLVSIESWLTERVKGQSEAIGRLARTVRLGRSGLRDPRKPRGVFLFVGPSGVGKTELARQLADNLFPEGNAFVRLDMSEYSEKFTISRLIGAPPGYAGHGEPGQLTGKLRRRPYAVVLLDEFEKAHPEVQTLFLSLFDEGHVTDAEGREVDAREALFILTSNAGSAAALKGRLGFGGERGVLDVDLLMEQVKDRFRPELLNRIDEVVPFAPLAGEDLRDVVRLHLGRLAERALQSNLVLSWTEEVVAALADPNRDPNYGARPAIRAIDTQLGEPLGQVLIEQDPQVLRHLQAVVRDGEIGFVDPLDTKRDVDVPMEEV